MAIERAVLANIIRRWMKGLPLDDRETSIVEAILQINAADQFIRCSEG